MALFDYPRDKVVTSFSLPGEQRRPGELVRASRGSFAGLNLLRDKPEALEHPDDRDQFVVFQLNTTLDGPTILECSQSEPKIEGSSNEPDVLVALEMVSFNVGANERVDPNTRATMRIDFGTDESSTNKAFDTVFWSVAAGLKLYDDYSGGKGDRTESKDLKADVRKAFGNRPIEVYGGLAQLQFQVVKHREPEWWQRIFSFAGGETGRRLVSLLGFPAITVDAIHVLNELVNRVVDMDPDPLFQSVPMRLALSKYANDAFTGGSPLVRMGVLNQGFCIMTRRRDFKTVSDSNAIYYPTYGKLVPRTVSLTELAGGRYNDPFREVTYVVFRVGMKSTKLDPTFNYGA